MHKLIAKAPQGFTRTPKRASRPLAVAIALLPFLGFSEFTTRDSQRLESIESAVTSIDSDTGSLAISAGNIAGDTSAIRQRMPSIDQALQNIASRSSSMQQMMQQYYPGYSSLLTQIGASIDSHTPVLEQIRDALYADEQSYKLLEETNGVLMDIRNEAEYFRDLFERVSRGDSSDDSRLMVQLFDPRLSVTNRVEVYSPSLSNQIDRLLGHSSFNTNYNPELVTTPNTSGIRALFNYPLSDSALQFQRSTLNIAFPHLSGDFLTDVVAIMRYHMRLELSKSVGSIRTVLVLDGITNRQQLAYVEDVAFHLANTNLLESIRSQDQDEYAAMDEFRAAVLAWIDEQRQKDEEGDRLTDEYLNEAESVEPERGAAPEGEFGSEDVEDYTDRLDTFSSELQDRAFPEYLTITFPELRPWGRSGSDASSDTYTTIKISLTPAKLVFDSLRLVFGCMYWGLSVLVLWWLVRLVLQMHHKIMQWTFTTTSVPS